MTSLVVGLGEIGQSLFNVLEKKYGESIEGFDIAKTPHCNIKIEECDILHICIPDSLTFVQVVNGYVDLVKPKYTVIHSSVSVGTTERIKGKSFHSPVRGKHPDLQRGLETYVKYLSFDDGLYEDACTLCKYFSDAEIPIKVVSKTKRTELMKLLSLSRYGVYLAFAKEQESICSAFGLEYQEVVGEWENTRNDGLEELGLEKLKQPILYPFGSYIGGHCTIEDMAILLYQLKETPPPLLRDAYDIGRNTKIWGNCNIYSTAQIGKGCSIGHSCEIGNYVKIGNNVRIGHGCFIPEGVEIRDGAFIAPGVKFSNDKHPPSKKERWSRIWVMEEAVIGMGSVILPGITIGKKALIGAGSVVTKSIPDGEKWYGQAAHKHGIVEGFDEE